MDQERIGILLSKLLAGEATLPEQKELESAFRDDASLRETWNAIRALKEAPPGNLSVEEEQKMLEKGLQRLDRMRHGRTGLSVAAGRQEEESAIVKKGRIRGWMVAAAAVFALVIAGAMLYSGSRNKVAIPSAAPVASKELVSKYGSRSFIELPDGSKLWLNAGSRVQYAAAFADGKRELTLSGEAYFDVKHDPAHPFVIHTGKLDVKVLGTTFNIKAYPGDSLMETTLIRGKVEVDFANDTHTAIVLKPSEKLIVSTGTDEVVQPSAAPVTAAKEHLKIITAPVVPDPADGTIEETSWVENKLVFRKEPFAQLALKLERWYNVKILFDNEKYRMDELTGTFKDQRIDEVMQALQITSDFHYRISGDTIHIW
jgi:ferric-dicitrate binding protein FerR (iron transport regulator)